MPPPLDCVQRVACLKLLGVIFGDEIWRQKTRFLGLPDGGEIMPLAFLADRTNGRAIATVLRLSSVCHAPVLCQNEES